MGVGGVGGVLLWTPSRRRQALFLFYGRKSDLGRKPRKVCASGSQIGDDQEQG